MNIQKKSNFRNFFESHIFIFFIFSIFLGIFYVSPSNYWFNNTNWLYDSTDLTNAQLSWEYFKNDQWRFPLGKNPHYGLEVSNSIIYTDNIPILALFFKLFKGIIYNKFQYFSLWITLTFFLQLFFSYLLIKKATKNNIFAFFSSFIFLLCPFLFFRLSIHFALGAHWIILYAFYIAYFIQEKDKEIHWFVVIFLSTLIHFYFTAMIFTIYSSFLLAEIIKKKNLKYIKKLIYKLLFTFSLMFLVGYFESSPVNSISRGYGVFKLDLLGFFDPKFGSGNSWSIFMPDIKGTNIEGFNYIGLGLIILFIISLISIFKKDKSKLENFNLFKFQNFYIIIFFFWALTTDFSIMGNNIFSLDLNNYIYGALSIFGATGRFAWPVIYILIFISLITIFKKFKATNSLYIILIILIIQIADIGAAIKVHSFKKSQPLEKDQIWSQIEENFDQLKTTYLFNNYGPVYNGVKKILGNMNSIKTNIILNAAMDRAKAANARYILNENIVKKKLDPKTAYIIDGKGHLVNLKKYFLDLNVGFFFRDDLWIMLPNKKSFMNESDLEKINNVRIFRADINKIHTVKFRKEYLGIGWTHNYPAKYGAWTEGEKSIFLINLDKSENKLRLILDIVPFSLNSRKDFELNIFINNKQLKKINFFKNKKSQLISIDLEKNLFEQDLEIKFELAGLVSSFDLLKSPDARKLGILLKSFEIKEIK